MVAGTVTAYPRLDDSFTSFTRALGTPRHTTIADGYVLRQYVSDRSSLTVLFEQVRSVALRLAYHAARRLPAAMQAVAAEFEPKKRGLSRLLLADRGWLLVSKGCSPAAANLLASL
jgi:hypothetical protein